MELIFWKWTERGEQFHPALCLLIFSISLLQFHLMTRNSWRPQCDRVKAPPVPAPPFKALVLPPLPPPVTAPVPAAPPVKQPTPPPPAKSPLPAPPNLQAPNPISADEVDAEGDESDADAGRRVLELVRQHQMLPPVVPPPEELSRRSQLLPHFSLSCIFSLSGFG